MITNNVGCKTYILFPPRTWENLPFDRNAHQMGRASSWALEVLRVTDCSRVRRLNWT